MTKRPKISVVSPVYGCVDALHDLVFAVRMAFARRVDLDWELVLVDDRGPGAPWSVICELSKADPRVRGVRLSRNHGQHLAIWAGLEHARGDWIAVIDCDLQDDPTLIPDLYDKATADTLDAVLVDRGVWKDVAWRRIASRAMRRIMQGLSGLDMSLDYGNFGIYSDRLRDVLLSYNDNEVFLPLMVAISGFEKGTIVHPRRRREIGKSSYSLLRLIRLAIGLIVRFSDRPLKLSVLVGSVISAGSALISLGLLIAALSGAFSVPGWVSTMMSIWFLSGLILATLGVHGIYIGRVFSQVQGRPRIIVQEHTDMPTCATSVEAPDAGFGESS